MTENEGIRSARTSVMEASPKTEPVYKLIRAAVGLSPPVRTHARLGAYAWCEPCVVACASKAGLRRTEAAYRFMKIDHRLTQVSYRFMKSFLVLAW